MKNNLITKWLMAVTAALILACLPLSTYALSPQVADLRSDTTSSLQNVTGAKGTDFTHIFGVIVQVLSIIIGGVAIIMIMVGGFRYMTAGGDTNRVSQAKNTLIYAMVGVAIAALAQVIVHFVVYQTGQI